MNRKQEVCRDFQRGHCRFGNRCRYLHVEPHPQPQQQQQQPQVQDHKCIDVRLCKTQIAEDFRAERPVFWVLTCYGHAKYQPNDVAGDVSFEELRAHGYDGARQGMSIHQVAQQESEIFKRKKAEFDALLNSPYKGPVSSPVGAPTASPFSFFNPMASASPFINQSPASSSQFGQPFAVPGFAQPQQMQQQVQAAASRSPFGPSPAAPGVAGSGVPNTVGLFQASNPFGVQANGGGLSWPANGQSASSSSGTAFTSPGQPSSFFNNPFSSAQPSPVSPFPTAQPSPGNHFSSPQTPSVNPFSSVPSPPVNSFSAAQASSVSSLFKPASGTSPMASSLGASANGQPFSSRVTSSPSPQVSSDIWAKASWSLGEIPEEEPPEHVRF